MASQERAGALFVSSCEKREFGSKPTAMIGLAVSVMGTFDRVHDTHGRGTTGRSIPATATRQRHLW